MNTLAENWERVFCEITNRCNCDCLFCPSGISERPRLDMSPELAHGLIDQLRALGFGGTIYFHVLGEPLLHRSVFGIVDGAAEAGMRPVLFTNGGALTGDVVRRILASRASEVVISMQTINRRSFELLRKTPFSWDAYLDRIQTALATVHSAGDGCAFRVSMGIKKADSEHPEERHFVEYESLAQIKESIADIFARIDGVDLAGVFARLDKLGSTGMPVARFTDRLSLSVKLMGNWRRVWRDQASTSGCCTFFGKEIALLSNGAVVFCHLDYDGRTAIGHVTERSLAEIVDAPEVRDMARAFMAGEVVAAGCEHCRGVKPRPG